MQTSWDGIKFICKREALCTVAYKDGKHDDGSPKYSIGFGSQRPLVLPGDTITIDGAFARMIAHVRDNDRDIGRRLKNTVIKQREWDALASLYYQAGVDELKAVAVLLNSGDSVWGILEFAKHHNDNKGLAKRRIREMAMACDGYYGDLATYFLIDGDPDTTTMQAVPFPAQPNEAVT